MGLVISPLAGTPEGEHKLSTPPVLVSAVVPFDRYPKSTVTSYRLGCESNASGKLIRKPTGVNTLMATEAMNAKRSKNDPWAYKTKVSRHEETMMSAQRHRRDEGLPSRSTTRNNIKYPKGA